MGIAAEAPRGGLVEDLGGASRPLVLRNGEIERFEDRHRGSFDLWDGFFGRANKPTSREVRDLVALGLVGGGMTDGEADAILSAYGPGENLRLYKIAQALLGVAFVPDIDTEDPAPDEDVGDEKKKKRARKPGASAE